MSERKSFRNSTIKGFYISQAREIGKKYFGPHLEKVVQNETAFDIYVYKSVDNDDLALFHKTWSDRFNIKLVEVTDYKDNSNSKKSNK